MKLHYFVAVVTLIATVTAALESDSHGNWSNEKELVELNYRKETSSNRTAEETKIPTTVNQHESVLGSSRFNKSTEEGQSEKLAVKFVNKNQSNHGVVEQQFAKQTAQPYVPPLKAKIQEDSQDESSENVSRLARASQSVSNETVSVEYVPSQEITMQDSTTFGRNIPVQESSPNDLSYSGLEEQMDIDDVGEFGQRVRSSFKTRNNENGRGLSRDAFGDQSFVDHRKQYEKDSNFLGSTKLNISDNSVNVFPKDERSTDSRKKQKETEKEYTNNDYIQSDKVKASATTWTNNEEYKESSTLISKDTSTSAPFFSVSLGKFSGPIVVPDLPYQKTHSYNASSDYTETNDASRSTPTLIKPTKLKSPAIGYLTASPVVLNPLQVGVALMNAGQDSNTVNELVTLTKDYLQEGIDASQTVALDDRSLIQNDASDTSNASLYSDQLSQQEQISEVVAPNSPAQSVEIQKSVEVYHTAPVQEIHYPVEFVPYVQQPLVKQRLQETDYRKLQKGLKDHRPSQVNVYKSNEILDETVSSNSQERSRYEYNVSQDDVVYSATNGQVDQTVSAARPADTKPVFGVREQLDNAQHRPTADKYSRVQGTPEAITKEGIKQNEYDLAEGQFSTVQSSKVIESLPTLTNLENQQGSQEVPQILLTKVTNEPPTELKLLMTVPQPYPIEKIVETAVHVPHAVDTMEKKLLYPIEKVIEKQVTIPQPFPVHVPVDRVVEKQIRIPYPIHVEKVIEKKIPFAVQRFIIPLPIHFRVPQSVPVPMEKVIENLPRPHLLEMEKTGLHASENAKFLKSVAVPVYNAQNDGNFQQAIRQQNFQSPLASSYGQAETEQNYFNSTQFYGHGYIAPNRPLFRQVLLHTMPKKFGSYGIQYPHSLAYSSLNGNNDNLSFYGRTYPRKDKVTNEYVGPVSRKASLGIQSKSLQYTSPDAQSTMRRTRQEAVMGNTGSFRQSKMEYGFKPPMVPSVQYDEQTATKVE